MEGDEPFLSGAVDHHHVVGGDRLDPAGERLADDRHRQDDHLPFVLDLAEAGLERVGTELVGGAATGGRPFRDPDGDRPGEVDVDDVVA